MRRSLAGVLFVLALAATCQAGVVYTFTGTTASFFPPVRNEGFQYTSPSFISSPSLSVLSIQMDSCVNCMLPPAAAVIFQSNTCSTSACYDQITFFDINNTGYLYDFAVGTFDTPGVHQTLALPGVPASQTNSGTLTVSPEPSTVLMMFASAFTLFAIRRKRPTIATVRAPW